MGLKEIWSGAIVWGSGWILPQHSLGENIVTSWRESKIIHADEGNSSPQDRQIYDQGVEEGYHYNKRMEYTSWMEIQNTRLDNS